jgi:hypothetical protein
MLVTGGAAGVTRKALRIVLCAIALILLFRFYTWGISQNPPGFDLDVQPHVRCEWETAPRISYITVGTTH